MTKKVFKTIFFGQEVSIETGQLAQLSNGSVLIKSGDTSILVTATASKTAREGIDFFPLSCDYEERMYAVGKIPGGFIKREGRPTEKAVLTSRLIDRPLRPLFPKGFRNNVQIIATVLSVDQDQSPEILAMIGSSVALSISDIPFNGPTGSVLVGLVKDEFVINPNSEQREQSDLHLTVSGTKDAIMMVEAGANELSEEIMLTAIMQAHEEIKKIVELQEEIVRTIGKEKMQIELFQPNQMIESEIKEFTSDRLKNAIQTVEKSERLKNIDKVKEDIIKTFTEKYPEEQRSIKEVIYKMEKEEVRKMITNEGIRPDNRRTNEIRPISSEVGLLKRTHGSGLFTRGQTQVMSIVTLGPLGEAQIVGGLAEEISKRYIHHYNFPPYSVGETGFLRGPGRREVGHGALAERALEPMIPTEEEFPYTMRVVSEAISSNGSTSQASVCASTLALLDAGVPLKAPVAGIAMGLIKEEENIAILTDIQGMEDFLGDMDFKVAGSEKGITAIQMDIKIQGIDRPILQRALDQARVGRLFILDKMNNIINTHREVLSPYASRIITMKIDPEKIQNVIGPSGKIINRIIAETNVNIDIDEDGKIYISAQKVGAGEKARQIISDLIKEITVGEVYLGKAVRTLNFGAFVELPGGKEGLIHISKLAHERVEKVEDVVNIGDEILVKVIEVDKQGRVNLSRKDTIPKENNRESDITKKT